MHNLVEEMGAVGTKQHTREERCGGNEKKDAEASAWQDGQKVKG